MSSGCGDVLSLEDLKTAKKHQLFEAEVITGKQGGVAGGADIDYATNQVTGQMQKTMPAILRDLGFEPASFDFTAGGTLGVDDRNKVVYDPVSHNWYSWAGTLPKVIPAGTNPLLDANWIAQTDPNLRSELAASGGVPLVHPDKVVALPQGALSDQINYVAVEQWKHLVSSGNWTAAIQAAIDYMSGIGGGEVRLAAKTYTASGLILKPMVALKGQGVNNTTIKAPDGWTGLAVLASVDFQLYSTGTSSSLTANGSYGARVEGIYIHGNYDNFAGTPSKFVGLGLAIAGAVNIHDVEVNYAPSVGYVHLNFAGSPNTPPAFWPADKGLRSVNSNSNIAVKWCGNDCAYIENYDSIYLDTLFGFPAKGVGTIVASFWDTTRSIACAHFAGATNVQKAHFYGAGGGHGVVWGHGDYTRSYNTYRWDNIVCETLCTAMWVRPTAQAQGGRADFHNINMGLTLPEFSTTFGTYAPGCMIQSGQFISGQQQSRQQSDIGKITFWNFTTSGSNPTVGFLGTHVVLAGENNTIDIDLHRSRFLDPALGGLALMCAGINNIVKGRITGFLATDSSGSNSAGVQFQPGSVTHFNGLNINRCNVGLRWSTNPSQPVATGIINITDNVTTYVDSYAIASALQRSRLTVNVPNGSNKQSALSAAGVVNVTVSTLQTISVTGLVLPYVPAQSEVSAWCFNDQAVAQTTYVDVLSVNYIPAESSVNQLIFRVRVNPVAGAASGQRLAVKIG